MSEMEDAFADDTQERAGVAGARPALIEAFGIRGLYGHRTISLASQHAATVLIARNGTGKTTLLGALDAFLKLQIFRLRDLEFKEIFCKIRNFPDELIITQEDVLAFSQNAPEDEVGKLAHKLGIDGHRLIEFLFGDYHAALSNWRFDNDMQSITNVLYRNLFHDTKAVFKACDDAYASMFKRSPALEHLKSTLEVALEGYEIVYLPTYRRVELALTDSNEDKKRRGRSKPKLNLTAAGLHTAEIQFGLGDISDRLSQLNTEIIRRSNREYREISENIINELINGYEVKEDAQIPSREDLNLFFSRLESSNNMIGPPYSRISAPDLEKIYTSEGVPAESAKFLRYFLNKLYRIINITKEIEQPVGEFINICNRYLSSLEASTIPPMEAGRARLLRIDAKALRLNPTDLSVDVESLPARAPISIDALSSGEKQMVSLFARMYLYPKRKIVLIDEPELSLSIDWQRGILIDVLLSPKCEQVIAITHSPFVFDNALEPFARTLSLTLTPSSEPELGLGLPEKEG